MGLDPRERTEIDCHEDTRASTTQLRESGKRLGLPERQRSHCHEDSLTLSTCRQWLCSPLASKASRVPVAGVSNVTAVYDHSGGNISQGSA